MPPKTGGKGKGKKQKKGKPSKTDGDIKEKSDGAVEKTKDELWEECADLQDELKKVQMEKKYFKIEMNNVKRLWHNSKTRLEKTKAKMREKLRLKQEAEKHYHAESEEHKLKLKQLRTGHHNELCELKMATLTTTSKIQEEHVESEVELQKKMYLVQADRGLKQSSTEIYIRELQQKHQEELGKLEKSYENQIQIVESEHLERMKSMAEAQCESKEIDKRMKEHTASSIAEHDKDWGRIDDFLGSSNYRCAFERDMEETKLNDLKIKQNQLSGKMEAAVDRTKGLTDSLLEVEEKLYKNQKQKVIQRKEMAMRWKRSQKRTACILDERRDLYVKHNQLELSHEQVQQEYKMLQERQTKAILNIQQKSNLKALVLENQIKAMTEIQEKEQLKLWVTLAFGQLDHSVDKNIKELFESKDATIKTLRNQVSQDIEEYDDLVEKAKDLGICADKLFQCGNVPVDYMAIDDVMKELISLSVSEHVSDQKDAKRLSLGAAKFRQ